MLLWLATPAHSAEPLRVVVMDPLAAPLSCACVEGVGQRRYDSWAAAFEKQLQRPVKIVHDEGLSLALPRFEHPPHLIIGKQSVVQFDAAKAKMSVSVIARLRDRQGRVSLRGAFLVPTKQAIQSVAELKQRRVALPPVEHAELHSGAIAELKRLGASEVQTTVHTSVEAAVFAVDDGDADAALTPDYLPPLLEGCGKIERGSMRVVGYTAPEAFVAVFATDQLSPKDQEKLLAGLLSLNQDAKLLALMESQGFAEPSALAQEAAASGWTDWRGAGRKGHSPSLPARLPKNPLVHWKAKVTGPAMAGIAANERYVVVPDKDRDLTTDIFRCFVAESGAELWRLEYPAGADIEYTNAPRATPVIHGRVVFLLGAQGDLHCVELASGKIRWKKNILTDFGARMNNWGVSSPPLVVDDLLIINPGAAKASLAALDIASGEVRWTTPGHASAYAAFVVDTFGGRRQIVGYDSGSLGGWDIATGKRLWDITPRGGSDFNVPTLLAHNGGVLAATENNGARWYAMQNGVPIAKPKMKNDDFTPDTCSPVAIDGRLFGAAYGTFFCLDLKDNLKTLWQREEETFFDHVNVIAGNHRLLVWTTSADLLLLRADTDDYEAVSHWRPFGEGYVESMSHPAIVGDRLYLRSDTELLSISLKQEASHQKKKTTQPGVNR